MKIDTGRTALTRQLAGILTIFTICLAWGSPSALARIGETPEECEKRYGEPTFQSETVTVTTDKNEHFRLRMADYPKKAYVITIIFVKTEDSHSYHAHSLEYCKPGILGNKSLEKPEIEAFLKANADGKEWRMSWIREKTLTGKIVVKPSDETEATIWKRSDGQLVAIYSENSLQLHTKAIRRSKLVEKAGRKLIKKDLSGF